jgi:hypothetical protein
MVQAIFEVEHGRWLWQAWTEPRAMGVNSRDAGVVSKGWKTADDAFAAATTYLLEFDRQR